MKTPTILAIIPARYQSSRFPGKPLINIGGKSIVQRVYEQAKKAKSITEVIIATDDSRIIEHVKTFGAKVVLTGKHSNGTSRCWEAYQKSNTKADFVINIQGDEPFIQPEQIDELTHSLISSTKIASMAKKINDIKTLFDPNCVKVVFDKNKKAHYFSRSTIPYIQSVPKEEWLKKKVFYKHIGLYAYRTDILSRIIELPQTDLEQLESLEQLRWIQNNIDIQLVITKFESIGIDTPEDIDKVKHLI